MAFLQGYPCVPSRRFSSWFHPMWKLSGGVAYKATTTEVTEAFPVDFLLHWGVDASHGWVSTITYGLDARVERTLPGPTYRSLQNGNVGYEPESSPSWWEVVDEGLGADDAWWATSPGLLRPDRGQEATGLVNPHIYARAGGVSGVYWNTPIPTGYQWSMVSGGPHWAVVRQSASTDTCYYAIGGWADDFAEATIWKCIAGSVTQIGYAFVPSTDGGNATFMLYAYGSTIGVARGLTGTQDALTGWPPVGWAAGLYDRAQEIILEVTDTSIPASTGPYVGVRAPAGSFSSHEWYGGELGVLTVGSEVISPSEIKLSGSRPSATVTVTERP
jgi:hypothetical protein